MVLVVFFCTIYIPVVQEAVATGDPELLQLVLERRDFQRYSSRIGGIPELLQKLKEVSIEPCIIISLP
jgi:septin 4